MTYIPTDFKPKLPLHETELPIKPYNSMRVGIVGAHGTGKTTLAKQLAEAVDLPLVPEQARVAHEMGFPLETEATFEDEMMIWMLQLGAELKQLNFIADRTLIDVCAYMHSLLERGKFTQKEELLFDQVVKITERFARNYDVLFYLPIAFPLVGDGVRGEDPYYQHEIDAYCIHYLNEFGGAQVSKLPLEGRLEQAICELKG